MNQKYKKIAIILFLTAILIAAGFVFLQKPQIAAADWFDDSWLYRVGLTVNNSGAADSNKKIKFDIDTAALITAGKMQSDCGDSRFTAANGEVLRYYIDASGGACNTNSTDYYVLVPTINAGATVIFHYYGNTSVINGTEPAQFSEATFTPASVNSASEERGPGPVAYWKFDEGFGQIANDSTLSNNDGTLGATSGAEASDPTWQTEDMCVTGKCLKFDGTDDYVGFGNGASLNITNAITVEAWIYPVSQHNGQIVIKQGGGYSLYIDAVGYMRFIVYKGGVVKESKGLGYSLNTWTHIIGRYDGNEVSLWKNMVKQPVTDTVSSPIDSGSGVVSVSNTVNPFNGFIDDVKIYPYARTAAQIKTDYASRGTAKGASAVIASEAKQSLSNGLVGYWKMDEASWTNDCSASSVLDASGAGNNGKACPATTGPVGGAVGKFGNGGVFDGVDDLVSVSSTSGDELDITSSFTLSAWIKGTSYTPSGGLYPHIISRRVNGELNSYDFQIRSGGFIALYTNIVQRAVGTTNVVDGSWHHVVGVYDDTNNLAKIFVDGLQEASTIVTDATINGNTNFRIGSFDTVKGMFIGSIDEVRVYNRALSPKEVRDLYNFAPGPVGWWKMDEKVSGNAKTLNDSSGNNNTGTTYYGANTTGMNCQVPGKIGGGCEFDGADDYIKVLHSDILEFGTGSFSSEIWFKAIASDQVSSEAYLIGEWQTGWYLRMLKSNGTIRFRVNGSPILTLVDLTSLANLGDGVWHHLAAIRDRSVSPAKAYLYVDGVLNASADDPTTDINSGKNLYMGVYPHSPNMLYLNGSLDDVRIYNYARTPSQIAEDYAGGAGRKQPLGYWKLDEGYGTTANNSGFGGTALNGTLTGMASPATASSGWTDSGKFGKALQFDGTDDVATITNSTAIDLNGNLNTGFTASAWVNADTAGEGSGGQIFWKGANSYLRVDTLSGGRVDVEGKLDLETTDANLNVSSAIATGSWNHIVMSYDGAAKITIWINGTNKGSNTGSGATAAESNNLLIGGTTTDNFDGAIDDFKIYGYELTEDEIREEYNSGVATKLGSSGTTSAGVADNSANRAYCIPGDTSTCNPPVAHWNFDEKTGQSANDNSGNANVGTLGSGGGVDSADPTWVSGKIGGALKFDGVDDYVNVGAILSATAGTVSFWMKPTDVTLGSRPISDTGGYIYPEFYASGAFHFGINDGGGKSTPFVWLTGRSGQWIYVTATWGDSGNIKLYIDGSLIGSTAAGAISNVSYPVQIGGISGGIFNGTIDDIRIYNYARTPAQVAWDYNRGKPVGWWNFDECQGGTANDASGNGNNGTITIGATGTQTALGTCETASTAWGNGATGKINSAMSFDGSDDYVDIADNSIFDTTIGSISLWFKWTGSANTVTVFNRYVDIDNRIEINLGQTTGAYSDESMEWYMEKGNAGILLALVRKGHTYFRDNLWHNVIAVMGADYNQIYVDGVLQAPTYYPGYGSGATGNEFLNLTGTKQNFLGKRGNPGSPLYHNGLIDEVKIYNYALTPIQVKEAYNSGAVNFR